MGGTKNPKNFQFCSIAGQYKVDTIYYREFMRTHLKTTFFPRAAPTKTGTLKFFNKCAGRRENFCISTLRMHGKRIKIMPLKS